ncbi:glycoside hydrolase family 27 protein [Granulicella tundricola]|uniref:Alpha-galactosidase n=1 Tax=Granulicella tundricola (strain ATCC BAA-1859 / DSM 23138 / MP5ACTX9) TaxID=1198114 RepID=E8X6Z7_GRATM|nr:glycoside hydrolase family 27 protein [Granulicella tundricola]ADW71106.1 Alpha-galactosidase [Granulicella tundricola MP5ACTX9]
MMLTKTLTNKTCLLSGLLLSTALIAQAQTGLNGYWDLRLPNTDGSFRHTYLELNASGETVSGKLFGRNVGGQAIEGTLKAGKIRFATVPPPLKPGSPASIGSTVTPIVYDGTFADGKLTLEFHRYNGGSVTGEAIRTTREAAVPPAPLPLPAPKDIPDNGLVRTPPMGWNSWNKFAGKITADDVKSMADAMVATGMNKAGYQYINIDDTWEADRAADGTIQTNNKFPDMKGLADYVHSKGLKIGIYSSPGGKTCAGYEGSFGHEAQDAKTFAAWGIDYLKYDLCGARAIYESTLENERGLYQKMGEALSQSSHPIVYSLCQYGDADVWKWGSKVGGNLWRTTGDIRDTWESMDKIGFSQIAISSYTRAGHWNDPDMLEIGNGGMTPDEYRTHMSLWSMLAAPLIAGNDLRSMSPETSSILLNKEVIAIDQDKAAKPVQALSTKGKVETIWRPMEDGSIIVGIYNRGDAATPANLPWSSLPAGYATKHVSVRDLWKHEAVPANGPAYTASIPPHGVALLRIGAAK